ncbi:MAG: helix-turn-helix domain-containing protein [Pseudonocardia sp.]
MSDIPTGHIIRLYRIDRKKNTTSLATHAGITVRYLEMIEAGTKTPTLHVLRRLAKVLGVRTSALIGEAPSEDYEGPVNSRLASIERALFTYDSVPLETSVNQPEDLVDRIEVAGHAWFTSPNAYTDVIAVLPGLIVETEQLVRESGRSPESCKLAYSLYRLTRGVMKHAGRIDLCPMIADRTMRYAEETEDPLTLAAASWTLGQTILSDDMPHGALDVSMMGLERLEQFLPDATPEHFSIYGGLVQCAAIASTRIGDPWQARDLLRDKAMPAANRIGEGRNHHNIFFGPTNVSIHAVGVELEAGDVSEAVRLSDNVDIHKIESMERRCAHLYHVIKAYECKGNDTAVFVHLKMAERFRPGDFRYKRDVRAMVSTLVRRAKPSYASEVREFAGKIGLID